MLAVFDWNGTIFEQTDDEELNRYIGRELLKYEQRKLLNPLTLVSGVQRLLFLLGIKKELEEMLKDYHKGKVGLRTIYEVFNKALRGVPMEIVDIAVDRFAHTYASEVDRDMLRMIEDLCKYHTAILSSSYEKAIRKLLEYANLNPFDEIVATQLLVDKEGRIKGFSLELYENKHVTFSNRFLNRFAPEKSY